MNRDYRRLAAILGALAAALLVGHFGVYRALIGSPGLREVPLWMWALQGAPELAVCAIGGWGIRGWRWLVGYAAGAGAVRVAFMLALAAAHEPGHGNNPEASVPYAAAMAAVWTILYIALFGLAYVARKAARSTSV